MQLDEERSATAPDEAISPITVRIPVAIKMTGIGRSKLYQLIARGEIDRVKIGTATLITVESLQRLMERNRR
ncbi:helix-turn-helix domain-containing protein [Sphingomonas sp. MG17]|uniref:Helix-turn-helix domain-containing protein n=2 Tax=Sphingomonas tagetis TaxID=2949092 RepID=A0A9X2HJX0_9SPHN|nr:helix-turn-helix domain-containing protein [Sphingomonas tagetis]MCP3732586.1 helix-turn-helix domain-containing protein [Sphingomonas tagetis]